MMMAYIDGQYEHIKDHLLDEGRTRWVNIPDFSGMRDIRGDPLEDIPINPDDILPKGWYEELNNAGKTYYWNESDRTVLWERPSS